MCVRAHDADFIILGEIIAPHWSEVPELCRASIPSSGPSCTKERINIYIFVAAARKPEYLPRCALVSCFVELSLLIQFIPFVVLPYPVLESSDFLGYYCHDLVYRSGRDFNDPNFCNVSGSCNRVMERKREEKEKDKEKEKE